ncbi:Hypothetical protein CINCED_3A007750 [Cinara cedri]|uniref:Uncharacterized protein n=1 Tax=Cinara cedri TaxID=506608 RepID=A0A5E4N3F7_9HEMI|nr:Hypothetical protein CINCED_3A007750 [Cinara cedri]
MPMPNGKNETNSFKKQRRWSLIGILSKKKKLKKSQESVDFCPYDGKINQKVAQNDHLKPSADCLIEQYTCSPRLIRRCNSLQYTDKVSAYSNIINTGQPSALNEWKSSQQSVYSSGSSACYSDIGVYNRNIGNGDRPAYYYNIEEENDEQTFPVSSNVPFRCSSEVGHYQNKMNYNNNRKHYNTVALSGSPKRLTGKKIPPPPPPRDPNVKAVYYFRNNRLVSRESDSTYFSQGSDDNISENGKFHETEIDECKNECRGDFAKKPGPRSRRPIQICDVNTLSTESEKPEPCKPQSVEEALQELENIYNSLGLSDDEDLLDRAERRDLPTLHQNMRYQGSDELDCVTVKRVLPKTRRSGVPDIVADDMAYRRLNRRESKRQSFVPGSFLLVFPTIYNLDTTPRPLGEPDITLDDVVFRSRRQNLNFLKIPDRQPPFGIPLGPIVGAAPSDYLHAVPEGRYKPSFHPRRVPDTVEDDLAFRSLRKDNKYKACFDFSFVHRNRFCKTDGMVPRTADYGNVNKIIKNDTHWIIEKTKFADRPNNNADRVKLLFDDSAVAAVAAANNGQNLMVVKINHHRPIMLSGFTLDDADRLSKSFFRTNLLQQHEPRNNDNVHLSKRDTRTTTTPDCAPQSINNNNNNNINNNNNNNCSSIRAPYKNALIGAVPAAAVKRHGGRVLFGNVIGCPDDDAVLVVGKNQPNFRELIEREYAHRTLSLTEYRPQLSNRRRGPACGDRVPAADNGINTIKSRNNDSNNSDDDNNNSDDDNNSTTTTTTTINTITTAVRSTGGAIIAFRPKTGDDHVGLSAPENRTAAPPPSSPTAPEELDSSSSTSLAAYPNRATAATIFPGYTEDGKDVNVT